ncbi:uncharacterized protein BT62DRAFT_926007 [Guyanagaster necrorhizus]|uniref:Uncharacterized protein n=1 Tax=Guyanagaster necrorhizus TaxID=856835 RepID=A0A9P7W375_9AGAR|nr:uncharacterized protein BT62DRAFT_926007 [Guyanagaster necrorhizus MCA 3950]KAG7451828.1 hypothetical protein BT62DRAFT_926007 [Guyanagaster necrorhizus MCA 3950]
MTENGAKWPPRAVEGFVTKYKNASELGDELSEEVISNPIIANLKPKVFRNSRKYATKAYNVATSAKGLSAASEGATFIAKQAKDKRSVDEQYKSRRDKETKHGITIPLLGAPSPIIPTQSLPAQGDGSNVPTFGGLPSTNVNSSSANKKPYPHSGGQPGGGAGSSAYAGRPPAYDKLTQGGPLTQQLGYPTNQGYSAMVSPHQTYPSQAYAPQQVSYSTQKAYPTQQAQQAYPPKSGYPNQAFPSQAYPPQQASYTTQQTQQSYHNTQQGYPTQAYPGGNTKAPAASPYLGTSKPSKPNFHVKNRHSGDSGTSDTWSQHGHHGHHSAPRTPKAETSRAGASSTRNRHHIDTSNGSMQRSPSTTSSIAPGYTTVESVAPPYTTHVATQSKPKPKENEGEKNDKQQDAN